MNPYSLDLRERVLAQVQAGELSQAAVAELFQVSEATVENWLRRWRESHSLTPKPLAGGPERTLQACAGMIREAVQQQPDATLQALCDYVQAHTGVRASPSMMCRELQILKLPRKKFPARHSTRDTARASPPPGVSGARARPAAADGRASEIHR